MILNSPKCSKHLISPAERKMKTLVVSSLYSSDKAVTTCAPQSLQRWFKANNVEHKQPEDCEVKIEEVDSGRSDYIEYMMENSTIFFSKYWEKLDGKLRADKTATSYLKVKLHCETSP